jgi:ethanolamine kinase
VEIVTGGITNSLYKVSYKSYQALVRVFGQKTEILIDRDLDNFTFAFLGDLGIGPKCFGIFANGRVEEWMDARPLSPPEMSQTSPMDFVSGIARQLAVFHQIAFPAACKEPSLWQVSRHTFGLASQNAYVTVQLQLLNKWYAMASGVSFPPDEATGTAKNALLSRLHFGYIKSELEWMQDYLPSQRNGHGEGLSRCGIIEAAAAAFVHATVYAHNDLLSGNILVGSMATKPTTHSEPTTHPVLPSLTFIDFEYGAYNYRGFDIANHFCEHAGFDFDLEKWYPSRDIQVRFLKAYINEHPDAGVIALPYLLDSADARSFWSHCCRLVDQFALASHFWWGLWAIIQSRYSPIDFDFLSYGILRFEAYVKHKAMFTELDSLPLVTTPGST